MRQFVLSLTRITADGDEIRVTVDDSLAVVEQGLLVRS
jgi:hypothetical protein